MGFRDLSKFNIALLAKQGWRILENPFSLVNRLIKAKYFPSSTFLDATLGSSPPFIWKSIWSARRLLEMGLRWNIGTGFGVRIWEDRWIPNLQHGMVALPRNESVFWVADLMKPEVREWNSDLIDFIFQSAESLLIKCIPLSNLIMEDKLVWGGEHTGIYTVRSGYKLLLGTHMGAPLERKLYKQIWNIDCPPKVRIALWRA